MSKVKDAKLKVWYTLDNEETFIYVSSYSTMDNLVLWIGHKRGIHKPWEARKKIVVTTSVTTIECFFVGYKETLAKECLQMEAYGDDEYFDWLAEAV